MKINIGYLFTSSASNLTLLLFLCLFSCSDVEKHNKISLSDLNQLRSIESEIKTIDKDLVHTYLDSISQLNNHGNNITLKSYLEILSLFYHPDYSHQEKIDLIKSLPLKSSVYILHKKSRAIALLLQDQQKYKSSIEELMNSLIYLENNPDLYYKDIGSTYALAAYIANAFTKEYEKSYELNKKATDLYLKHNEFKHASRAIYNNGVSSLRAKKYIKAKECFRNGINYSMKANNYKDLINLHYSGLISTYSEIHQLDSMDIVLTKAEELFESKKVSKEEYYEFLTYAVDSYASLNEYDLLKRNFKPLEEYFKESKNPQTLKFIYSSKIQLAKINGSPEDVKKYLLLSLKNVEGFQFDGANKSISKNQVLEQLIEIAYKEKNYKELHKWHKEKDKIQERSIALIEEKNEIFKAQSELWFQKDLEYAEQEITIQKDKTKNFKIALIIFITFSIFLIYLFYKLNSFAKKLKRQKEIISNKNKRLKSKNKILENKNDIINQQNNKLNELLHKLENTNQLLKNSNKALNNSLNDLAEANNKLENFAQIAAHDIKAPLRSIHNYTQIIQKKYYDIIKEKDQFLFDFIMDGTNNLSELVTGLLQFSSLTDNLPEEKHINLNDTILLIKNQLNFNANKKNASINITNELPTIKSHPTLIEQLLLNILNNSIKFSKKNEHNHIQIYHQAYDDNFIKISIKDNGIGIPKTNKKKFSIS